MNSGEIDNMEDLPPEILEMIKRDKAIHDNKMKSRFYKGESAKVITQRKRNRKKNKASRISRRKNR